MMIGFLEAVGSALDAASAVALSEGMLSVRRCKKMLGWSSKRLNPEQVRDRKTGLKIGRKLSNNSVESFAYQDSLGNSDERIRSPVNALV